MLYNVNKIKKLSEQVINDNGTNDQFLICKLNKIIIIERNYKKQLGAFAIVNKISFIFLNANISYEQKKVVVSHELGHYFLHRNTLKDIVWLRDFTLFSKTENILENEANLFAAYLLIDKNELIEKMNDGYNSNELSKYCCVDEKLINIFIKNLL